MKHNLTALNARIRFRRLSMSIVINGHKQLKSQYKDELEEFKFSEWTLPQRAARLAAASKRCRTAYILEFIFNVWQAEVSEGSLIEMSPYFAKDLAKGLFGRSGSHALYVSAFAKEGRVCRNQDHDQDQVKHLIKKYKPRANRLNFLIDQKVKRVKAWYKKNHINTNVSIR